MMMEYLGEVISKDEANRRLSNQYNNSRNFYLLKLKNSNGEVIDATKMAGMARYINHSCNPNLEANQWRVGAEEHILLMAKRDISNGEELTWDYQYQNYGTKPQRCYCGERNCRGYLDKTSVPPARKKQKASHHLTTLEHKSKNSKSMEIMENVLRLIMRVILI